jgi:Transposase DDE domain
MYIERLQNQFSVSCILLRESFRVDGKVRKRTVANLSKWPEHVVDGLQRLLRGESVGGSLEDSFEATSTRPHGHVAAVLGSLEKLGIPRLLGARRTRERDLVLAMVVARILDPRSKLATARGLGEEAQLSTLGELLNIENAREDDLYGAMDWLRTRQESVEKGLASKHLSEGCVVLYDLSSTYFEGRKCRLAKLGHSRDGKRGKLQITFGLLCDAEGRPVAVEVFEGNTGDPTTLRSQIARVRERFGLKRIVLVGDRGMITEARIREDLRGVEGLDWITCLRTHQIRDLVGEGSMQMSLFDDRDLAEIQSPDFPNERLVACRNPLLAAERARKRQDLLAATEAELAKIATATQRERNRLVGKDRIALRVGKVLGKYKVGKHFDFEITETSLSYHRNEARITAEAALDGIYVIRTSVPAATMDAEKAVATYKSLAHVERAFRSTKTVDLKVRPIYHYAPERVRAHVFLCMLAYYVEWHMRRSLAPLLFDDEHKDDAQTLRESIVAPAVRSSSARRKDTTKRNGDGLPVQSFQGIIKTLGVISKNKIQPKLAGAKAFDKTTTPSPLQQRALDLLGVRL